MDDMIDEQDKTVAAAFIVKCSGMVMQRELRKSKNKDTVLVVVGDEDLAVSRHSDANGSLHAVPCSIISSFWWGWVIGCLLGILLLLLRFATPHVLERPIAIEHLHSVIALVAHEHHVLVVHCDACWMSEFSCLRFTAGAKLPQELAFNIENLNSMARVCHQDLIFTVDSNIIWLSELSFIRTLATKLIHETIAFVCIQDLYSMIS